MRERLNCVRGIYKKCIKEKCQAWVTRSVGTQDKPNVRKERSMCIDLWEDELRYAQIGQLETLNATLEQLRNGTIQKGADGNLQPKPHTMEHTFPDLAETIQKRIGR